jgi:protein SCO1
MKDARSAITAQQMFARFLNRHLRRLTWPLAAACLIAGAPVQAFNGRELPADRPAAISADLAEIEGLNWDGQPFRMSQQRGKVAVLFFGYTSCPDVCPATLSVMKQLYRRLGARASEVAVVFVSVDPARDSAGKLANYMPVFDTRFFGVHLERPELTRVTSAYGVTVVQHPPARNRPDGPYLVDHTGLLFVLDRQGRLRLSLPAQLGIELVQQDIETLLMEPPR